MLSDDGEGVDYPPSSGSFLATHIPLLEEAREKGIKHFGHEHPLKFKEDIVRDVVLDCNGCGIEMGRSGFSCCKENCSFYLHEFCASLPKQMKDHPEHPQHSLILHRVDTASYICDVCDNYIWSTTPFCYRCVVCDFDVDLRCASMSFLVCHRTLHKHELTAQLYPASFLCCFCGEKHEELGMSYLCKTCSFWIHEQCYSLPSHNIPHDSHAHPLQLLNVKQKYFTGSLCGVCEENVNHKFHYYGCHNCKYAIHIKCSTMEWDPTIQTLEDQVNDQLIQFPLPSNEVLQITLAQFIQNICHEDPNGDILNHPSHDHPLILQFNLSKFTNFNDIGTSRCDFEVCNACMLPLLNDAPFYSCNRATCNFALHKWCATLPRELKHPAHTDTGHTLILQDNMDDGYRGFFECNGCREKVSGFAYKCNECKSYCLDVTCATLPRSVKHEDHKHPLLLKHGRSIGGCFSCSQSNYHEHSNERIVSYFTFGCDACHFCIHPKCLLLPREILYWYDEHGFKLTDPTRVFANNDNQGSSAYHCEFCEKDVDINRWIYHCFECDQCIGVNCVRKLFDLYPFSIKVGRLYHSQFHNKHPLTCIFAPYGFKCNWCQLGPYNIPTNCFECTLCEIMFCVRCVMCDV